MNTTDNRGDEKLPDPERREKAFPQELPDPVYWPFFLALGLTFLLWGLLTTWIIVAAGGVISIIALAGWIKTLYNERK